MVKSQICSDFARNGNCRFKNCKFIHQKNGPKPEARKRNEKEGNAGKRNEPSTSKEAFRLWRQDVPLSHNFVRPLGTRLSSFFAEARRLIDVNDTILQDIIHCLSKEGGLKRIQELIEREYDEITPSTRQTVFTCQILPFLEIITHPNVVASLILEQSVGTIYNVIFGLLGRRAVPLVKFLAGVIEEGCRSLTDSTIRHLELCLLVFLKIIELNSTGFICEAFKPLAGNFEGIFMTLYKSEFANSLLQARAHLERIQRRLEIGSTLPHMYGVTHSDTNKKPAAVFERQLDPPGGRHDNDFRDICKISVMPTFQEISCTRREYLPVQEPSQWHVAGVAGLLDRNFRLLREDTIGQLRDAIHAEMRSATSRSEHKSQVRTHVYKQARVVDIRLHRLSGFQFYVEFHQPDNVRKLSANNRQEWWKFSKRLQSNSLVCLTDLNGVSVFCTVARPDRPKDKGDSTSQTKEEREKTLWKDTGVAYISLELVEGTEANFQYILNQFRSRNVSSAIALVEFPGVLLPAFQPTLLALQKMKEASDIPFSELLAPSPSGNQLNITNVPPPVYATKYGFSFDLSCLMTDRPGIDVRPGNPVDIAELQEKSSLDKAQAAALVNTLQRRIGLIQGPPGTGKSYTGVALLKVLLANRNKANVDIGPIICVCYTNHALDQLLEELLDKGVTSQIVRIGSGSKTECLEPLNLRNVARNVERTKSEQSTKYHLHRMLDDSEENFQKLRLEADGSEGQIKYYLQRHYKNHYNQFFGVDGNGFQRATGSKSENIIRRWLSSGEKGKGMPRPLEQLQYVHVDQMTGKERQRIHQHWTQKIREDLDPKANRIFLSQQNGKKKWDKINQEQDLRCLRTAHVIGLTTSGLARNLNMLRRLQSKVVLCEEAGEVLEAHLLSTLLPSVEHLILIGDHLQLRPQIQNYELSRENHRGGEQYSLDISLFERLVQPVNDTGVQIPFSSLETQRRMHPSIARLIRDTLYPRLEDAPSVFNYPPVSGMRKRLFWLDHQKSEVNTSNQDAMATSHWNDYEIQLVTALVNYLIQQGTYQSGEIAVLTPYLGQLHRIRRYLSQHFAIILGERDEEDLVNAGFEDDPTLPKSSNTKATLLQSLRVATIDNFQGEQAKVVVISLVRSNEQSRCGFLRTSNRINVLLSRAQHGMYIIGNSATYGHVPMWGRVIDMLREDGNFGTSLELQCQRHPGTPIRVREPDDFVKFSPEGGCSLLCKKRLLCGHPCIQKCHSNILHSAVYCLEPCLRPLNGCSHSCPKLCGDKCPRKCEVRLYQKDRILPCGHFMPHLACWETQNLSAVLCPTLVKKKVPTCGHEVTVACHLDVDDLSYKCKTPCRSNLPCGHTCKRECWQCNISTLEETRIDHGVCKQICGRNQSTCAHTCKMPCHGQVQCNPCSAPCDVQCGHSKCSKKCSEPCAPCAESNCLSSCPHSVCSMPCAAPCDHVPCSRRCEKLLPCNHQCPSVCGERCPAKEFCQECANQDIKNTSVDFILGQSYQEIDLNDNPCIFPRCGHFMTIESMDGQMSLGDHYEVDSEGRPLSIAKSSQPFSIKDIKTCAACRGSLRDISRYGRLVRRALLDESTKKLILYMNQEYIPIAKDLAHQLKLLQDLEDGKALTLFDQNIKIKIEGPRDDQLRRIYNLLGRCGSTRYRELKKLRDRVLEYNKVVDMEEQPYRRVRNFVENVRRRKDNVGSFDIDNNVLQTKGNLQAKALLLRLDIALIADFLSLYRRANSAAKQSEVTLNLQNNRTECQNLIETAKESKRVPQQVEGYIFIAQLYAMELPNCSETKQAESHRLCGKGALDTARELCREYPGQTSGFMEEIEDAEKMLNGLSFYTAVTNDERMAVLSAMAQEFRGTGHWYYCQNGHPFTIGECGMAMQLSTCPECNAPVGGQSHQAVDGVQRAEDLERNLGQMTL